MEKLINQIKVFFKTILNIRSFIIVLALIALIFPTKLPFIRMMNAIIFKTGSYFMSVPDTEDEVVIIHLPPNLVHNLTQRPASVPYFNKFLYRLKLYNPSAMAIILEDLSRAIVKDVYVKISLQFLRGNTRTEIKARKNFHNDYDGFDGDLADTIRKNNILVGNIPYEFSNNNKGERYSSFDINAPGIKINYRDDEKYVSIKKAIDILSGYDMPPLVPSLVSASIPFSPYMKNYEILPIFKREHHDISHPLIWNNNNSYIPDLVTMLYAKLAGSRLQKLNKGIGLQFEFGKIQTDNSGRINPLFSNTNKKIPQFSLSEILSTKNLNFLRNKIILIGKDKDVILEDTAYSLLSLRSGFVSFTPNWVIFVEKMITILMLMFFIFLFPKLQSPFDILLSSGLVFAILFFQLFSLILFKVWTPLTVSLFFFIIGSTLYISKNIYKSRSEKLNNEKDSAFIKLGTIQFENRQFDQSFLTLRRCETSEETLDIIYNIGIEFQRRNQFNKAISVFSYIIDTKGGFKDAVERMKYLSDFMRGKIKKTSTKTGSDKTLDIPHIEINRLVLGRYEIEKELGRGAMGIVYLGKDPKIGRSLAIKTLDFSKLIEGDLEKAKYRFFQEAKTIGMLNHPNLVVVYDVGEEDEIAFIAMDYVPGKNLTAFTKKGNLLPIPVVFALTAQVADALDYAHEQNVIHRDIKPGNIIYNKKLDSIKVTDFGIARMMDSQQTRSDIILGSPSYMSPEQLRSSKIDGRSDIFSLGVTFYQLLTGRYPFEGEDLATITYKITKSKPINVIEIRPELPEISSKILDRALQKVPDKRFQTAKEMAGIIREGLKVINTKKR
ncbi:MAG: serine/threonine protein kinase [Desulfobacterales bacterium]|nr:serine/threonine protein kinase [Desulfobacterales bacterium]